MEHENRAISHTDYALWKVIVNGDAPAAIASVSGGVEATVPPKTTAEKIARRNELKAKSTISEGLDKTYDKFQKLISQLEIHGEVISQEDTNLKLLRSLPPAWNTHTLIMQNKSDLDTLSMDDLYNSLKVCEAEIKGQSRSSLNSQNVAFVSSDNTSSTNEVVNTAHSVSTTSSHGQASTSTYADDVMFSFFANQSNSPQSDNENLEQIDTDDLEEIDLKWQVAMLTMRVKRFIKKTGRNLNFNGKETVGFNKTKVECYNCHMRGHFARECRSYQAEKGPTDFTLTAFSSPGSSSSDTEVHLIVVLNESGGDNNQENDRYKTGEGYHAVHPPYTGNFMPPRPDLSFTGLDDYVFNSAISKPTTSVHETKTSTSKTTKESMEKPKTVRPSALKIEDWESDSDDDCEIRPSIEQNKPTVITNSGKVQVNAANQSSPRGPASTSTARYVSTAENIPTMNVVSAIQGNRKYVVKSSACWIWRPTRNVIDHISKDSRSYMLKRFNYVDLQGRLKSAMAWETSPSFLIIKRLMEDLLNLEEVLKEKEKHHKASCKRKLVSSISQPLQMLHMDLFGPTFVKSLNNKMYFLVVIDGFSRTPNLDLMKPYGCLVTILNTLDHLGKFEGKADEGFLVGYSVNSKTFRSSEDRDAGEVPDKGDDGVSKRSGIDDQGKTNSSTQYVSTAEPSINTASINNNTGSLNINTVGPNDPSMTSLEETGIYDDVYGDREVALADPSWIEAMQEELFQFKIQKVWTLVDLSNNKRAIGTKWVFRNKKDERGIIIISKARLVAQGHTQEEGIDYDEVFAPVARIEAIRIFLAYASFMGFIVYQMGVESAFLYGTIEEEVYVCQPPGFKDPHFPKNVYKVEKALYGLHQAPRAWYETLSTYLLENRFKRGTIDKTLFIKKDRDDILLVQVYVNDIIFGSTKKSSCDEFEQMMHKRFQMSSIGELTFFLGLQVKQKDNGIFISQDKYVADILKKFDFTTVKTASTLIEPNKTLIKDAEAKDVDVHLYRSMIGSLMYLIASRPDIMFAVCACARFQVTIKTSHLHDVKRIFRYLNGQPKLGLWHPRDSPFNLEAFFDSDYARASLDRNPQQEVVNFLAKD
nr:retrovirus-related Pol polyprotein from transposon TNT 1-94 [Tanacetum cinerariifolium]